MLLNTFERSHLGGNQLTGFIAPQKHLKQVAALGVVKRKRVAVAPAMLAHLKTDMIHSIKPDMAMKPGTA